MSEIRRVARRLSRATETIEKWTKRRDKPSLQEVSEKLTADAGLSLTFTPRDEGRLERVQISIEINEHNTLSIDRRATREVQRSLGVMATTSWATERARFMLTREKGRAPDPEWQLEGDSAARIVLHYLDAAWPEEEWRWKLRTALNAIARHPAAASEAALRASFDEEEARTGRVTLYSSTEASQGAAAEATAAS